MLGLLEEPLIRAEDEPTDPPPPPPEPPPTKLPNDTDPPPPQEFGRLDMFRLATLIPAMRQAQASIERSKRVSRETLKARITI